MIYVMSDIHGEYEKYLAMLRGIDFSEDDTLYILGDAIDRGPESIKALQDMASRDNVYFLKGNHEAMASFVLHRLNVEITEANVESQIDLELIRAIMEWQQNGGDGTMEEFRKLSTDERADILDFIDDAPLYDIVDVGDKSFILVHSGWVIFRKKSGFRSIPMMNLRVCVQTMINSIIRIRQFISLPVTRQRWR